MAFNIFREAKVKIWFLVATLFCVGVFGFINFQKPNPSQLSVISTSQAILTSQITVGRPVQWSVIIKQEEVTDTKHLIKLPKTATSINIGEAKQSNDFTAGILQPLLKMFDTRITQTKDATYFDLAKPSITGATPAALSFGGRSDLPPTGDIIITYITPAPTKKETQNPNNSGKTVTISGPNDNFQFSIFNFQSIFNTSNNQNNDLEYTNVLAYTTIPEIYNVGQENLIKIKWTTEGGQEVPFTAYDTDSNGKIDRIEWTVPHLSEQTFNIIYISKAFQLDKNQNIVADIYDTVKAKDGNYATVPQDNYVRVTFEQILDNTKDITVYAKPTTDATPSIEVYTENGTQLLATFPAIDHEGTYKIYLTELTAPTDVFDLRITNASIDIDYIVDPSPLTVYSSSSDGYLYQAGPVYLGAHDATVSNIAVGDLDMYIGQNKTATYGIYRIFLFFDTSSIPVGATITSATLSLYGEVDGSTTDFDITIQNGQPTYPHNPLVAGDDYVYTLYSGNGGTFNTFGFNNNGYNDITLNETGLSWIQKGEGAETKLALLSSRDISATAPTGAEYIGVHTNEQGEGYQPKLVVNYTVANTAPVIGTGPSDGGSSSGSPTTVGNDVTFTATATDTESDNYYLAICKTDAVTAVNNGAPTCDGGNWCISGSTASASGATCAHTATGGDTGNNNWYAFVCDHNSVSACSTPGAQSSGDNGSPFFAYSATASAGVRAIGINMSGVIVGTPAAPACASTYTPDGAGWAKVADTLVRDISGAYNATIAKDIYCDDSNCVLWTDGAAAPSGTLCIATDSDIYASLLWSKTDENPLGEAWYAWGPTTSISGGDIGGTHGAITVGNENTSASGKNWLARDYTSIVGTYPAMDACKTKGDGWRLPNILELDSIRDQAYGNFPTIPYSRLPNISLSLNYWSSTESASGSAYYMGLSLGVANGDSKSTSMKFIRCVRGAM